MSEGDRQIPILSPRYDLSFEHCTEDENLGDNGGGRCFERTTKQTDEVRTLCQHLKKGAAIVNVEDGSEYTGKSFTRIINLQSHNGASRSQYEIVKYQPGPVQRYSSVDNNEDTEASKHYFLTTDSQLCLVEELSTNQESVNEEQILYFVVFYVNFVNKRWFEYKFQITSDNIAVHTCSMASSQLFIYFNRPLKIFALDFSADSHDVIMHKWESPDVHGFRSLTCLNFVILFTNQKDFTSLTFTKDSGVVEAIVKRPNSLIRKEYDELVQLVNINGRIFLIAQKESTLLFLKMQDDSFVIAKKIDFKEMKCFQTYNPIIVKNMICWKRSRLFIPLACMKPTFPQDNQVLSESLSIVDVDMKTLNVISVSQIDSKVNIYQDVFNLTVLQHGGALYVQKERRHSSGNGSRVVSGHVINLYAPSLKKVTLLRIANVKQNYLSDMKHFPNTNRYLQEQILTSFDF